MVGGRESAALLRRGARRRRGRARARASAGGQDLADERRRQADHGGALEQFAPGHAARENLAREAIGKLELELGVLGHDIPPIPSD